MTDARSSWSRTTPNDEELTLRAFRKASIANRVVVVRDGAEALDYFFCRGAHAGRRASEVAQVVLLDLKLPKVDGLDVLRALRADPRTRLIPVVILTSSAEEQDLVRGLPPRRQQLRPQAGRLHPVRRGGPPARAVLAGDQPVTAALERRC